MFRRFPGGRWLGGVPSVQEEQEFQDEDAREGMLIRGADRSVAGDEFA
jgi:hypothetical protein